MAFRFLGVKGPRKKVDHLSDDESSSHGGDGDHYNENDQVIVAALPIATASKLVRKKLSHPKSSVANSNINIISSNSMSSGASLLNKLQVAFCVGCIALMMYRQMAVSLSASSRMTSSVDWLLSGNPFGSSADICVEYEGRGLDTYSAPTEKSKVKTIHLIGERHQGTKWITAELENCFQHAVKVEAALNNRHKHWFQRTELENQDGVVVAVFRNIYSWVHSMNYVRPHHAPQHFNIEWEEFVTRPWTLRGYKNFTTQFAADLTPETSPCWQDFLPNEMEPCLESERLSMVNYSHFDSNEVQYVPEHAAYELRNDGSGQPYDSIVDMRADKIRNFLQLKDRVHSFYPVQYEHMMHHGVEALIATLERDLNIQRSHLCNVHPPKPAKPVRFPAGYLEWMRKHVDWEAEGMIGYGIDDIDPTCSKEAEKPADPATSS